MIKAVLQLKQLKCLISDHKRDVKINYNITTKQMALFRKLLVHTIYAKRNKNKNVAPQYCNKKDSEICSEPQNLRKVTTETEKSRNELPVNLLGI